MKLHYFKLTDFFKKKKDTHITSVPFSAPDFSKIKVCYRKENDIPPRKAVEPCALYDPIGKASSHCLDMKCDSYKLHFCYMPKKETK